MTSSHSHIEVPGLSAELRQAVGKVLGEGALLFGATAVVSGLNYLYHVSMGPLLGPERYGEFATLLGVLTIVTVPASVAQMALTQHVARFRALGLVTDLAVFSGSILRPLLAYGILVALILVLFRGQIADVLNLSSGTPILVLSIVLLTGLLSPLTLGVLNGTQRFAALSVAMVSSTFVRCMSGILLVVLGAGAVGALAGSGFAALSLLLIGVSLAPAFFKLSRTTSSQSSRFPLEVLIGVLALNVLIFSDLVAVKHFFPTQEAGFYAAAATLGKALLFLPGVISLILLPKVTHSHTRGEGTTMRLRLAVGALLGLCSPLLAIFILMPTLPVRLAYGPEYLSGATILGLYGVAMTGYAISSLLLWYYLAIGDRRFPWLLLAAAVLQGLGFLSFHEDLRQIVTVLACTPALLLVVAELICGGLRGARTSPHDAAPYSAILN